MPCGRLLCSAARKFSNSVTAPAPPPEPPRPLLGNSLRHRNGSNRNFKVSHQVAKDPNKSTLFFRGVLRKEVRGEVEGLKIRSGELSREKGRKTYQGTSQFALLHFELLNSTFFGCIVLCGECVVVP